MPGTEVFLGSNLSFTIRVFTWGPGNDDNIFKKEYSLHLINNTINWNNTTSNLWEQSNEKVLQLTQRHVVQQNLQRSYEIMPTIYM